MACDRCHTAGDAEAPSNEVLLDLTHGWIHSMSSSLNWTVRVSLQADPLLQVEQTIEKRTDVRLESHERKADDGEDAGE